MYLRGIGADEQKLARDSYTTGRPLPDAIANAPKLELGLTIFLQAFYELHSERTENLRPIPWRSINDYAEAFDFDEEQREMLFAYIKAIDNEYLATESKRHAAKSK